MWSPIYEFTTQPDDLNEFSFIGVTDPQSSSAAYFEFYTQTLDKAIGDRPNSAFMVNLGDMVISENSLKAKAEIVNIENGRLFCTQYSRGRFVDVTFVMLKREWAEI